MCQYLHCNDKNEAITLRYYWLSFQDTSLLVKFSAHFNLAKFLVPIVNPFTCNEFTTVNTHSFLSEITSVPGASNYYMVSFDVENLFTNVPLYETIDFCLSHLFIKTVDTVLGLPRKFFKTLLELSLLNSFFFYLSFINR